LDWGSIPHSSTNYPFQTLSDTEIKKAKIKDKDYKLADGQGLYLVIKANGTKFFRYDYSFLNKRKSMSFWLYPDTILKQLWFSCACTLCEKICTKSLSSSSCHIYLLKS